MFIKRSIDIIASFMGLSVLSPFLGIVAIAIKIDDPGPVFFRQERAGKDGSVFWVFKFRSMVVNAEKKGAGVFVEEDDPRITKVGQFLRNTSIDELPQLINVLKGEMSLVGPRPTLPYQVKQYDARQWRRLKVKPGITGWAQVNGRNELTWPERIELDLWYIDNLNLWLDIKILFKTVLAVLSKQGLYSGRNKDPIAEKAYNRWNDADS